MFQAIISVGFGSLWPVFTEPILSKNFGGDRYLILGNVGHWVRRASADQEPI